MATRQKITTFLWFNDNAEDAARFYTSIFPNSKINNISRWGRGGPAPEGSVMSLAFELFGQGFIALNGGPHYTFSPATSQFVSCDSQEEVDAYWNRLLDGGTPNRCGWIDDRFGVTWQIIPSALMELMSDPDPVKAGRVAQAMMGMVKIDVAALQRAHAGQ
jgi:predicted 3-demethylubiquinone-9 3-methyltransferase (glyoxalase superfamily)